MQSNNNNYGNNNNGYQNGYNPNNNNGYNNNGGGNPYHNNPQQQQQQQQNPYNNQNPPTTDLDSTRAQLEQPLMPPSGPQNNNNDQLNPFVKPQFDVPFDQDIRQSYAADANPLLEKNDSKHIQALIASIFFWGGIPTVTVLTVVHVMHISYGAMAGILAGIYILYLIIAMCCNSLFDYLKNLQNGALFHSQYNRVTQIIGYFHFHVTCYHYQTRHHTRTVSDGNGGTRTQHYTTTQKVITYTNSQNITPIETKDDSGSVDDIRAMTLIIFVRYLINYRFVDQESRINFDYFWQNFKIRNKYDVHQDYGYKYVTPGLKERMAYFIGNEKPKYYGNLILLTLIGLIWPYSMYIEGKISRYDLKFMKILRMPKPTFQIFF